MITLEQVSSIIQVAQAVYRRIDDVRQLKADGVEIKAKLKQVWHGLCRKLSGDCSLFYGPANLLPRHSECSALRLRFADGHRLEGVIQCRHTYISACVQRVTGERPSPFGGAGSVFQSTPILSFIQRGFLQAIDMSIKRLKFLVDDAACKSAVALFFSAGEKIGQNVSVWIVCHLHQGGTPARP